MSTRVLLLGLIGGVCLIAQIGGQYPPGQYPPGQYPQGRYPDDRGGGLGLPFPGRNKKADQNKKSTISLTGKITKQDGVKSTIVLATDDDRNIELKISTDT